MKIITFLVPVRKIFGQFIIIMVKLSIAGRFPKIKRFSTLNVSLTP
jgi:hypothetical protein